MEHRYDQTERLYRKVLQASSENLEALNNLAWLLAFEGGKDREALELIDRAIEIAGSHPSLLDTRAVVYLQMGKPEQAIGDLREALTLNPQKPLLYVHLARAHQMSHRQEEARKALQRAVELGMKPESIDPLEQPAMNGLRQELGFHQPG
jgi:tetratricopeptide (TPR) repeat protein